MWHSATSWHHSYLCPSVNVLVKHLKTLVMRWLASAWCSERWPSLAEKNKKRTPPDFMKGRNDGIKSLVAVEVAWPCRTLHGISSTSDVGRMGSPWSYHIPPFLQQHHINFPAVWVNCNPFHTPKNPAAVGMVKNLPTATILKKKHLHSIFQWWKN